MRKMAKDGHALRSEEVEGQGIPGAWCFDFAELRSATLNTNASDFASRPMQLRFDRDRTLSFGRFLWQRFVDDKCFETAGALSYTTLVSLVPLTVAVLTMFAAFPMFETARETQLNFVFNNFRSEEQTSELQSPVQLVCRLL